MTTALAVAAGVLAVVALVLVGLLIRRLQSDVEDLRAAAVHEEGAERRASALPVREGAFEPRTRDLDDALALTLEAARDAVEADAALLALHGPDGTPVVATLGLTREEAERLAGSLPPLADNARSVTLSYRPLFQTEAGDSQPVRTGVAVPVPSPSGRLGSLAVLSRDEARSFGDEQVQALEYLADRSGLTIADALHLQDEEPAPERFPVILERAVAEAHLRGRSLALALFQLQEAEGDAGSRLGEALRTGDLSCRVDDSRLAALLPGAEADEARELAERLGATAGVASLDKHDTPEALLAKATAALERAAAHGRGGVVVSGPD